MTEITLFLSVVLLQQNIFFCVHQGRTYQVEKKEYYNLFFSLKLRVAAKGELGLYQH